MKTTRRGFLAAAVATLTATSTHMATNTPTYDFDREDPGADGWTDRMNGNFSDLDTLLSTGSVNGTPIERLGTPNAPTEATLRHINGGYFFVGAYDGATLDAKIENILSSADYTNREGNVIIIHPPEQSSTATTTAPGGTELKWKWENTVTLGADKLTINAGWANITATASVGSFFDVGTAEKRENITFNGGFWYSNGNATEWIDTRGCGHLDFHNVYLQGSARNDWNSAIKLRNDNGISEVVARGCEITGATNGIFAEQGASAANESVFDMRIDQCRIGGGTAAIRIEDGDDITITDVQSGGAATQSVDRSIVELVADTDGCRTVKVDGATESNNNQAYNQGVFVFDSSGGTSTRHDGIIIDNVDTQQATEAVDIAYADNVKLRSLSPHSGTIDATVQPYENQTSEEETVKFFGPRTSDPHAATGSGDYYLDLSTNPPSIKVDDPTDTAWESI